MTQLLFIILTTGKKLITPNNAHMAVFLELFPLEANIQRFLGEKIQFMANGWG